jgi:hypothetical protein
LYDSIHACGCWHQFFPTQALRARPAPAGQGALDEGMFAPQPPLPVPGAGERVQLRVASRTHQLQRVTLQRTPSLPATALQMADEDTLRSLPMAGGGHRSVYDPHGLVPGSERLERFVFWPMGIRSAGQMRQWGRHPTAFVGRRHFDDPRLPDLYFEMPPMAESTAQ